MSRRFALLVGFVSLVIALGVGWFAETQYQALVATTDLAVPAMEIPPYTIVTRAMFKLKSFPAPIAIEPVYRELDEVTGKMTTIALKPDQLVYRDQLVLPRQFRYSDDERLEIISFPIKPEQAVGGQIKPGQRINIYRLVIQMSPNSGAGLSPDPKVWLATPGAGVELLQSDVQVVDVRSTQGSPVVPPPNPKSNSSDLTTYQTAETTNTPRPLTILTVAVPPDVAKDILRLAGESSVVSRYLLWASLAPIVKTK